MSPRAPRWTPDEQHTLASCYYRLGAKRTTTILHQRHGHQRTIHAVRQRARKTLHQIGIPNGWVPLVDVHTRHLPNGEREAAPAARIAATKAGVTRNVTALGGTTTIVPTDWADAYVTERAHLEETKRRTRAWLTTREAATTFGVTYRTLCRARSNPTDYRLATYLNACRTARVLHHGRTYLRWHPDDVRAQALAYRHARRRGPAPRGSLQKAA